MPKTRCQPHIYKLKPSLFPFLSVTIALQAII